MWQSLLLSLLNYCINMMGKVKCTIFLLWLHTRSGSVNRHIYIYTNKIPTTEQVWYWNRVWKTKTNCPSSQQKWQSLNTRCTQRQYNHSCSFHNYSVSKSVVNLNIPALIAIIMSDQPSYPWRQSSSSNQNFSHLYLTDDQLTNHSLTFLVFCQTNP